MTCPTVSSRLGGDGAWCRGGKGITKEEEDGKRLPNGLEDAIGGSTGYKVACRHKEEVCVSCCLVQACTTTGTIARRERNATIGNDKAQGAFKEHKSA